MPGFLGGSSGSGAGGEIRFPAELIDPVTKLRVSEPQTLIDTDFEYGLQPTKWETVELINNTPSFFSKSGDTTIPNIESITTTATSREIKVTTGLAHGLAVGIPINVSGTKSLTADGAYIINSVPTPTTFTYLSKQNQPEAASIEDLYTSIVSGEFFQGSQIKIADSDGIVTDAQGSSILTVKTESPHGFGVNTPFYFLNLNSTVSQEFDSSNTSSKAFDAANSSTAQIFDGSNTLTSYRLDLDNNAVSTGTVSSISTFNPSTNQITVAHTTENFVGLGVGAPLYHNITTAGGYFATNPRGVVFLKSLDTSNTSGSIFTVSQVPNGTVIAIPNALTGTFQRANEARLFAGNNINTATETSINLVEEEEKTFNGTNTDGQFLNNCSFSGSNVTGASGSGVADLDLYQGLMVKYETTGTPPTINAGGDATNGGSTTSLVNNRTYFIESSFQVGSSINYVTTLKEFPTSTSNINFTSTGTGTHKFTVIGIATDKDIFHLKNHGYVLFDMLRYTYPAAGHFGVATEATELKDYYFVDRLFGPHNFTVNFTIGEISPKLQEFIGLTAQTGGPVNVTFTTIGFTGALTFAVTSGTLPSGLSINSSTGAITGTPSAAYSQATIRVTVTDSTGTSDFADVTFQINPPPFLFDFTSATFSVNGVDGQSGMNVTQARAGAGNPSWSSFITMPQTNGYIVWQVPRTATYRFEVYGAGGGYSTSCMGGNVNGYGARMRGDFNLNINEFITLLPGQNGIPGYGSSQNWHGSGGGGMSAVCRGNDRTTCVPMIVVGAGAGSAGCNNARNNPDRSDARIDTYGNGTNNCGGSTNGGDGGAGACGGGSIYSSAGGGGFYGNGGGYGSAQGGTSFRNGGTGGTGEKNNYSRSGMGGFGGGGAGQLEGGAGGGWAGGRGESHGWGIAGGGGSYNNGANQSNSRTATAFNGYIVITRL
jgi:hypothetical protein